MIQDAIDVLDTIYRLEETRLRAANYDSWLTIQEIADSLPAEHPQKCNSEWVKTQLDILWRARRVLQVPDNSVEHTGFGDVELVDLDRYGSTKRLKVESNDCRQTLRHKYERVAIYPYGTALKYRSRIAEIARLLSYNYQRFNMAPSTGILSYERRPQERPERNMPIAQILESLCSSVLAGYIIVDLKEGRQSFKLSPSVDVKILHRAIESVLVALQKILPKSNPSLSVFQVQSFQSSLCGLYSTSFRKKFDLQIITAGVGSGKSYAFQLAALVHITYRALLGKRGVSVLLLYPRVVLAGNQFKDLYRLVEAVNIIIKPASIGLPLLDAGGQLATQMGFGAEEGGRTFRAIQAAYGGKYGLIISNLDTLANRLIHPEACRGLTENLDLIVLDEIHLLSGLYGSHAKMVLKRCGLLRAMWRLRTRYPNESFESLVCQRTSISEPYIVGASATIAEPIRHAARILDNEEHKVLLIEADTPRETGWVHHMFLRQRVEASSMTAAVNATSCLIHNRRNGLFREYYEHRGEDSDSTLSLSDLPNPLHPSDRIEPRVTREAHKTLGFSDSLDNIGRWADLVTDNEETKASQMLSRANPHGRYPYFVRFQEPLWRIPHHIGFGQQQPKYQTILRRHYGVLCLACKEGRKVSISRIPPNLSEAQLAHVEALWDQTPGNNDSYLSRLGVRDEIKSAPWFKPVIDAGNAQEITNLDKCPFFAAGLCWWWSADHAGNNAPRPVNAANPLNGIKMPARRAAAPHHFVSGIRVLSFTSYNSFDIMSIDSINDIFRIKADRVFRVRPSERFGEEVLANVAFVIGSPRLEVGVDLDNVQEGMTFQAMRDPASLQQKVGRIGREKSSDALVVHVVTQNVRDQYYFRNPHVLLDSEFLQPIPLHENNLIIARHHYFMAIVDFLCLQSNGPNSIPDDGHRLDLINDHLYQNSFSNWYKKVKAVYEYLFGNHPKQETNLQNVRQYLSLLGASDQDIYRPGKIDSLGPNDAPRLTDVGALDVFRHEFGPNFFLTPFMVQDHTMCLAKVASFDRPIPPNLIPPSLPVRHNEFLRTYNQAPPGENPNPRKLRSYLWNLLTLPLFRRGIPSSNIPGDQPFVWAPNLFSMVGNEVVRIFEVTRDQRTNELGYETVSRAISLLMPGTVSYRFRTSPRKVPVGSIISSGQPTELANRIQAVYLNVDDPEFYEAAAPYHEITEEDLPEDYDTLEPLNIYTPRQIPVIESSSQPLARFGDGMLADEDSRPVPSAANQAMTLASPPRCFSLKWYKISSNEGASEIECHLCRHFAQYSNAKMKPFPKPPSLSVFKRILYDPELLITEFAWGLDRQFPTRQIEPARLLYRMNSPQGDKAVALGHSYKAPAIEILVDSAKGSVVAKILSDIIGKPNSAVYQSSLFQYLHYFIRCNACNPLPSDAPPWEKARRPSPFTVRDLKTIIMFNLLRGWHPSDASAAKPANPPVFTLDDVRGSFSPGHQNHMDEAAFKRVCALLVEERDAAVGVNHYETLCQLYPNYVEACNRVAIFTEDAFQSRLLDILYNSLSMALRAAALRLTGAEDEDLGYFYKAKDHECRIYLFDRDALGNGTCDLIRDTLHISETERVLTQKMIALGHQEDPLPTKDFAECFEEELAECKSWQAGIYAFHSASCDHPSLVDIQGQARGERKTAGKLMDFIRRDIGLQSFDHLIPLQLCPEYLSHISRYNVYGSSQLVGSAEYPNFQSLQSALGFCTYGCLSCLLIPEQNIHGSIYAQETINKLLLNLFYDRVIADSVANDGGLRYPAENPSRTVPWEDIGVVEAEATGKELQDPIYDLDLPIKVDCTTTRVHVTPSARPGGWNRVLRLTWDVSPTPVPSFRPRMAY